MQASWDISTLIFYEVVQHPKVLTKTAVSTVGSAWIFCLEILQSRTIHVVYSQLTSSQCPRQVCTVSKQYPWLSGQLCGTRFLVENTVGNNCISYSLPINNACGKPRSIYGFTITVVSFSFKTQNFIHHGTTGTMFITAHYTIKFSVISTMTTSFLTCFYWENPEIICKDLF